MILTNPVFSQAGIEISAGGKIETTGTTTILINSGNFSNAGIFSAGLGNTVTLDGTNTQSITANATTTFYNLVLSGSNVKTLPSPLVVNGDFSIKGTVTATVPGSMPVGGNVVVGDGSACTLTIDNAGSMTVGGNLIVSTNSTMNVK